MDLRRLFWCLALFALCFYGCKWTSILRLDFLATVLARCVEMQAIIFARAVIAAILMLKGQWMREIYLLMWKFQLL